MKKRFSEDTSNSKPIKSNEWINEYQKIEKDLYNIYATLEESIGLILVDIEDGQSRKLTESEVYDRTIKTIDIYILDANRRIENLKLLNNPDVQQANKITFLINRHTENVQGFFVAVFTDSELSAQLDGFDEKRKIRTKCYEYFKIIRDLRTVLEKKAPAANPLTGVEL